MAVGFAGAAGAGAGAAGAGAAGFGAAGAGAAGAGAAGAGVGAGVSSLAQLPKTIPIASITINEIKSTLFIFPPN